MALIGLVLWPNMGQSHKSEGLFPRDQRDKDRIFGIQKKGKGGSTSAVPRVYLVDMQISALIWQDFHQ